MRSIASLQERFERSYIPEPNSGCWLWIGNADSKGYGRISLKGGRGGPYTGAHRVALLLAGIEVGAEMIVCHKCDVPMCVNPAHLFIGTQGDNLRDMARKGRAVNPVWLDPRGHRILAATEHWHFGKFKTHCKRGHAMTPENIFRDSDGHRRCLACKRMRSVAADKRYRAKLRAGRLSISAIKA